MRSLFIFLIAIGLINVGYSQNDALPLKAGKVNFYDVVTIDSLGREVLFTNAENFLSKIANVEGKRIPNEENTHFLYKEGSFFVYKKSFAKSIHGSVTYKLTIEVKDYKYRYSFTDFIFNYYKRNRYGRFVQDKGKYKRLEDTYFKGMQKIWESHKQTVKQIIDNKISALKIEMSALPQVDEDIATSSKKDKAWEDWED